MKKTIVKFISTLRLAVVLALLLTSCHKQDKEDRNEHIVFCAPIPDSLKVPAGNSLQLQAFARGVQIYQVKRSAANPAVISWVNIAPLATLYEKPDFTNPVILHYAGPTWEFTKGAAKGEKVVAARLQGVTKNATAIQWLLLKAVDSLSTANNKITFVQRICTTGGLAPASGADEAHVGQLDSIPYTASYLFYTRSGVY